MDTGQLDLRGLAAAGLPSGLSAQMLSKLPSNRPGIAPDGA